MFTSFSTALSALDATSTAIDVVGNNLANLNTPGFKDSTTYFRDLVTESLGAGLGETQVGFGTGTPMTIRQFTQGAIQSSSGLLDAAIAGDGFFVVSNAQGNQLYTRAGSFQVDDTGTLRTNTGEAVQGWTTLNPTTGDVDTNLATTNIVVPVGGVKQPVATSSLTLDLNLNSAAAADATSDHAETIKVYDTLGTSHTLTMNFEKTDANTWSYSVTIPGEDVSGGTAGTRSGDFRRFRNPHLRHQRPVDLAGRSVSDQYRDYRPGRRGQRYVGQLESLHAGGSRSHHAVRPTLGTRSEFAEWIVRVTVNQGRPG